MITVTISPRSEKPIYRQLYDQISAQIVRGELQKDFALPPIRSIAKELRISVITVKKAWEMLERDGLIYSVVGRGCFVEDLNTKELADKRAGLLTEKLRKDLAYYKDMGLSLDEMIEELRVVYGRRNLGDASPSGGD